MTCINKQVIAMKIYVKPVNIGSVDEDYFEIDVKETQNLREVYQTFQTYLGEQLNCDQEEYNFDIDRIAILQESRPNTKLIVTALISQIVLQGKSDKFTFIFPRVGLPIIQIHDGDKYYYIENYSKDEFLNGIMRIQKEIKQIVESGRYEYITINGQLINYQNEKDKERIKKFLENNINKTVNISIKIKSQIQKQAEVKDHHEEIKVQKTKKEAIKKEVREEKPKYVEQKKEEKQEQIQQKKQPKKQQRQEIKKEEKLQQPHLKVQIQEPQAPANIINEQPNKGHLKLVIKFQSNTSNKKQEFSLSVDPAKTMLQLLPQIIQQLKSKGFHWQQTGFDSSKGDRDKLRIIYAPNNNVQFKKLERPLKSFVDFPKQSKMIFTFERHYEGGA